jgi:CheY-like chemotaxis protein/signal transduction histidine kinase
MNISDKIISLLSPIPNFEQSEVKRQVFLFNFVSYISLIILLVAGTRFLILKEVFSAIMLFSSVVLILLNKLIIFPALRSVYAYSFLCAILGLLLSYNFYAIDNIVNGWFWIYIYPAVVLPLMGVKRGLILSLILLVLLFPGIILPDLFPILNSNPGFFISLLAGYISILLLIYFSDYIYKKTLEEQKQATKRTIQESERNNSFITGLSHQLRTSLSNIILVNSLVETSKLDNKHKELIDTLQASTNNLAETINKIVDVSRPELIPIKESSTSFDPKAVIRSITRLFRKNEDLVLSLNVSDKLKGSIIGDPIKLKQIFLNLLQGIQLNDNNYKQSINIRILPTRETNDEVELSFVIESSFHRVDKESLTKTECEKIPRKKEFNPELSRKMIDNIGGRIEYSDRDDKEVFTISILYKKDIHQKAEEIRFDKAGTSKRKKISLENANVLLVEDNRINQKIVILSIENLVRSIDVAANGKEALDKFGKSKYDIILMDIQMPVMNGIVATKKIRELEVSTNTNTPIIAITANALAGDRENCLAVGMDDYISKPFSVDVLIQKMENLLQEEKV